MSNGWEYARLFTSRDPQDKGSTKLWLQLPRETEWQERESEKFWSLLDELGADGWELVGSPVVANGVFTYKASTGVWHDKSVWMEQNYLLKRPRKT
jgi:hypothetical protein